MVQVNICTSVFGFYSVFAIILNPTYSWTCRSVEDPGVSSLQLLVAADVSLHQSICEDM